MKRGVAGKEQELVRSMPDRSALAAIPIRMSTARSAKLASVRAELSEVIRQLKECHDLLSTDVGAAIKHLEDAVAEVDLNLSHSSRHHWPAFTPPQWPGIRPALTGNAAPRHCCGQECRVHLSRSRSVWPAAERMLDQQV